MDPSETFRIASRSIRANRLRSALTVLGIVIGIASVIAFATFGASVQAEVIGGIGDTNANNVFVVPAEEGEGGPGELGATGAPVFTQEDVRELDEIEGVRAVIPQGIVPLAAVSYDNRTVGQNGAIATVPSTFGDAYLVRGRAFRSGAEEVVLNRAAAASLAGNDTLNTTIRLTLAGGERRNVTVVGIVSGTRGGFSAIGDETPQFYLPVDPFYRTTQTSPSLGADVRAYPQVTVVADPARVSDVKSAVERYMTGESDARRLLADDQEIRVRTSGDIVDEIEELIGQITRFVTGIAVISLVVGAIGIANITLVSVAERTKEIGIMKAVGARNRDVLQLFLTEAVILGVLGAVVGVPLGLGVGWAATAYAEVQFALATDWLLFAVAMGIVVGVAAGLYPAWRASNVDPIDALRYE